MPARSAQQRLLSGSCSSAHSFAPRFLPTLGRPHAVALRFVRRDQLTVGLAPTRVRPCWAHIKNGPDNLRAIFIYTPHLIPHPVLLLPASRTMTGRSTRTSDIVNCIINRCRCGTFHCARGQCCKMIDRQFRSVMADCAGLMELIHMHIMLARGIAIVFRGAVGMA
jgi:hypothetical protein